MNIAGAAPKIAIPTLIYLMASIYIDFLTFPLFKIAGNHQSLIGAFGFLLLIIGIGLIIYLGRKIRFAFKSGALLNDGLFLVFRNPMYATYLLLIIPGLAFMFNSWIVLTTVIVNYILFRVFIKSEYRYLEGKYGDEYRSYLNKVRIKFL